MSRPSFDLQPVKNAGLDALEKMVGPSIQQWLAHHLTPCLPQADTTDPNWLQ